MLLGLGALLVTITLVSFSFNKYIIDNANFSDFTNASLAKYALAIAVLELISWYT
jgi:hypothetical protein